MVLIIVKKNIKQISKEKFENKINKKTEFNNKLLKKSKINREREYKSLKYSKNNWVK